MNIKAEKELNSLIEDHKDKVKIGKKTYSIGWLKSGTQRKMSNAMVKYGDDDTMQYRCTAYIVLNNWIKIHLFAWILWRWFFYIKEYLPSDLAEAIEVSKKKVQLEESFKNMVHLLEVRDTRQMTTMTVVESIPRQQTSDQPTH